jgi:serine/threonine protein kinase
MSAMVVASFRPGGGRVGVGVGVGVAPEAAAADSASGLDIGQILGKGGFAEAVYLARVRTTGQEVALKVVSKTKAGGDVAAARLAAEVKLHRGLSHPAVVGLAGSFEDDRFAYLSLELCGGGDLYRFLRRHGSLELETAAAYTGQIASGLAYLHSLGILHRDLKLSNLLLSVDYRRVKISDFGLAAKVVPQAGGERHTLCGTPNYMAPEVASRRPYSFPADLWSVGCLLYSMIMGRAPFQGRTVAHTLSNVMMGKWAEPSAENVSVEARQVLRGLLCTDPSQRMSLEDLGYHDFLRLPSTSSAQNPAHRILAESLSVRRPNRTKSSVMAITEAPSPQSISTVSTRHANVDAMLEGLSMSTLKVASGTIKGPDSARGKQQAVHPEEPKMAAPASACSCPPLAIEASSRQQEQRQAQPLAPSKNFRRKVRSGSVTSIESGDLGWFGGADTESDGVAGDRSSDAAEATGLRGGPVPVLRRRRQRSTRSSSTSRGGHRYPAPAPAPASLHVTIQSDSPQGEAAAPVFKAEESSNGLKAINTSRLPPSSYASGNASFAITAHRCASVAFASSGIWLMASGGEKSCVHVGRLRLCDPLAPPKADLALTVPDTIKLYQVNELPNEYHAAYRVLSKAVGILRSRTPKVTLNYGDGTTAALMENSPLPDFRMQWVDGSSVLYQLSTGLLSLSLAGSKDPVTWSLEDGEWPQPYERSDQEFQVVTCAQEALLFCLELERQTLAEKGATAFPVELAIGGDPFAASSPLSVPVAGSYPAGQSQAHPLREWDAHMAAAGGRIEHHESKRGGLLQVQDDIVVPQGCERSCDVGHVPYLAADEDGDSDDSIEMEAEVAPLPEEYLASSCAANTTVSGSGPAAFSSKPKVVQERNRRARRRREVAIPGVGIACKDSAGDLKVLFEDGSVVIVNRTGNWLRFQASQNVHASELYSLKVKAVGGSMPPKVRCKMKHLPHFITRLQEAYGRKGP